MDKIYGWSSWIHQYIRKKITLCNGPRTSLYDVFCSWMDMSSPFSRMYLLLRRVSNFTVRSNKVTSIRITEFLNVICIYASPMDLNDPPIPRIFVPLHGCKFSDCPNYLQYALYCIMGITDLIFAHVSCLIPSLLDLFPLISFLEIKKASLAVLCSGLHTLVNA